MENSRYLACLARDYDALRASAASAELTVPVPGCPGWTMGDLVFHVAEVYLRIMTVIRTGEWARSWPPEGLADEPRLALLERAYGELAAELTARDPAEPARTWYRPDRTAGFWARRMAQETVIHRIDAEQAAGVPVGEVPDDLAVDGVDEVLKRFLAYGSARWPEEFAQMKGEHLAGPDGKDVIVITAGQASWAVFPSPDEVVVQDGGADQPRAVIQGAPDPVLRWLWGRAPDEAVEASGDPAWVDYLRRMLSAITV